MAQTKEITYEAVVEVKGMSKQHLMTKAKHWFWSINPENVIHMDTVSGKVIGVGLIPMDRTLAGDAWLK